MAYATMVLIFLWMSAVMYGAFAYTPSANILGETARVIYFHVPVAWVAVLAFCMSLWNSVAVLRGGGVAADMRAEVSARLGIWFCVLATITGAFFAKAAWGMYWNWDPREVSIVVLLLVYMAYFGLRAATPDQEKGMRISAVYAILAFIMMPFLVFVVPWVYSSLHPDTIVNTRGENQLMDGRMRLVFFSSLAGFTLIYLWLYNLSVRVERMVRSKEGFDV